LTDKRKLRTAKRNSPLLEIARVLVRFDHVARISVNADERNFADKIGV
jgi:hypothetical protein